MDHYESYQSLKTKLDEELLDLLGQGGATVGSPIHGIQEQNRELAKAILEHRSVKIAQRHNTIMTWLTVVILLFTIVVAILTGLLVYKEFGSVQCHQGLPGIRT